MEDHSRSLIITINNNVWWKQATRDLEQIPLFIIAPMVRANHYFGINIIAFSKNGLIDGYKKKSEIIAFKDRFKVDFNMTVKMLKKANSFCDGRLHQDYDDKNELIRSAKEFALLVEEFCPAHLAPQLWDLCHDENDPEKKVLIKLNKKKIDLIRSFPIFQKFVLLLRKFASYVRIDESTLKKVLFYTLPDEFVKIVSEGKLPRDLRRVLDKRSKGFVMWIDNNRFLELNNLKDALLIEGLIKKNLEEELKIKNETEIVGTSSFKGFIRGRVRNIDKISGLHKVRKGEILVSSMVTPEYSVILGKVAAVIVDESGLLSHVQVLAREFKKPFIYDTKTASSILRNGQIIEIKDNVIHLKN